MQSHLSSAITSFLPELHRYGHYLSDHPDTAEELVQQTVERLLKRQPKAGEIEDLKKYTFSILRNLHNDFLRQMQRDQAIDRDADPTDPCSDAGLRLCCQQILQQIATLPPAQRDVLNLVQLGYSYAQIARRLELPIGTVMSRISRAREALRGSINLPEGASVIQWLEA